MSAAGDLDATKTAFQTALNDFKSSFAIFDGTKKHGRDTKNVSDWFKDNNRFNSSTTSVDIRAYTIQKLQALYRELQQDAQLLNSGAIELDKFREFYSPGKILFIVKNFLAPSPSTTICFARFKQSFFKATSNF